MSDSDHARGYPRRSRDRWARSQWWRGTRRQARVISQDQSDEQVPPPRPRHSEKW